MIQFYAPDIESNPVLPPGESLHCAKVLRLGSGEKIQVIDGRGHIYRCTILEPNQKHTLVAVDSVEPAPLPWTQELTVAVAPTKHMDRMEWMVEKLTEIGVNRIIPLLCERSERRELKTERLEKIAVSAMKQSLKAVLPVIEPLTPVAKAIQLTAQGQRYIAHCDASAPRRLLACEYAPGTSAAIFIGPEGDFSPAEVRAALGAGFVAVSLGDNRLRTETAAVSAVDTFHILDMAAQCAVNKS